MPHERGSGHTYRQVLSTPDGGTFVVHSGAMTSRVRDILRTQGRTDVRIVAVASEADADKLRGLHRDDVVVDHAFGECADPETRMALHAALARLH